MKKYIGLFAIILLTFISSCSTTTNNQAYYNKQFFKSQLKPRIVPKIKEVKKEAEEKEIKEEKKIEKKVEIIKIPQFLETEDVIISTFLPELKEKKPIKFPKGKIQISIENMPIYDFINLVFGKLLKLNYTVSPNVQNLRQNITLNMTTPMKPKQFFSFIIDFLEDYQIEVSYKDGIFYIKKSNRRKVVKKFSENVIIGRHIPKELSEQTTITMAIPLYYIKSYVFANLIKQFINTDETLISTLLTDSNVVFVSGKVSNIKKIEKLAKAFDRPYFSNKDMYLLSIEYLSAKELKKELEKILVPMGIPISEKPKENYLTIVALDRKNALLIISPKKEWTETVLYWKKQIDTIEAFAEEPQLFIYKPKNRSAEDMAKVLESVLKNELFEKTLSKEKSLSKPKNKKSIKSKTTTIKTKTFNISVDKERNSIIVFAYPSDYKKIKRILEKLDTQPNQILIEVTIAEITLTDQLQFGFEWYLKHSDSNYIGELKTLGGLGLGGNGFTYSLLGTSGKFNILFNMFAKKNLINIVSTPHIVVLDGKEATINVGTEVPVVSSETTAPDVTTSEGKPSILRNVQYRNTGVILSVKPVITSENRLNIDVSQELSEAQTNNISNIDSPLILNRSIKTSLNIVSGQTVLLGGLISENSSKSRSKVPILGDIPFIGHIFSVDSKGKNKTELIVLITPYIIKDKKSLDEIMEKLF